MKFYKCIKRGGISNAIVSAAVKTCGCRLGFSVWNPTPVPACPRCAPAVVHFPAAVRTIELSGQQTDFSLKIGMGGKPF